MTAMLMAVGVLGVSTSGPLIAAIVAPALAIAFWRNAFATAALAPWAAWRHRAQLRSLRGRPLRMTLGAGVLLAAHFAAWIPSVTLTTVAASTALVCLQAGWTAVLERLLGVRMAPRVWIGLTVALAGVVTITGVDLAVGSARAVAGDLLAVLGGVFSAAYVVVGSRVRATVSTTAYTLVCYGTCSVVLLAVCLVARVDLSGYPPGAWAGIVALTVFAQLLGHSVFNAVLRTVSPTVVSLVILVEVPGAALLAAAFLGQVPPAATVPGLALVLVGIAVVTLGRDGAATGHGEAPPD